VRLASVSHGSTIALRDWADVLRLGDGRAHSKWRTFTSRPFPPKTSSEVMLALSCDSRDAVDAMNGAAAANGGTAGINPIEDHGFMYTRDLADPDGHALGAMWMDMSAIPSSDKAG
jgi:predicted lactoylglutathione lyase